MKTLFSMYFFFYKQGFLCWPVSSSHTWRQHSLPSQYRSLCCKTQNAVRTTDKYNFIDYRRSMCYESKVSTDSCVEKEADLSRRQQHFHTWSTRIVQEWAGDRVKTGAVYKIMRKVCVWLVGINITLGRLKTAGCLRLMSELVSFISNDMKVFVPSDSRNTPSWHVLTLTAREIEIEFNWPNWAT